MKAFDVGGWCNYCSILITDIPFETIKAEVRAAARICPYPRPQPLTPLPAAYPPPPPRLRL